MATYFCLKQQRLHFLQIKIVIVITITMDRKASAHNVAMPSIVSIHDTIYAGITSIGLNRAKSEPKSSSSGFPEKIVLTLLQKN